VKDIPEEVCYFCGEGYLTDAVTDEIGNMITEAISKGIEVEILRYAA